MQDLIQQSERRSVRNISIDKPKALIEEQGDGHATDQSSIPPMPPRQQFGKIEGYSSGRSKKWWWIGGGVLALLVILIVVGSVFAGASVSVTPRQAAINLDTTFAASLDPVPGTVGFEVVTVSKEATRTVKATGSETISRPASGTIVVYNDTTTAQRFIKNTRFQTPSGLIYRIPESISIPAKNGDVPGSVETKVFADSAGEEYNIDLSDFVVATFKEENDPLVEQIYARSKTAMTGGFEGTVKIASETDTEEAEAAMETELAGLLVTEATNALPEGFVIIPESGLFSYETLPNQEAEDDSVIITVRGEGKLLAVSALDVAQAAAADRIPGYAGEPVAFSDVSTLRFALEDSGFDLISATSTSVRVSGPATLVWTFDIDELKEKLAGKSRSMTAAIFGEYPGIERADVVIRPFWKRSLPDAVDDINVTIENES